MWGLSAVAIAGVDSAWRRRLSSFATRPSTHFSASIRLADVSSVIESNTLRAIIGTRTFSSKFPWVPATLTAVSFPITWAATWSTTSGITGFTLPEAASHPAREFGVGVESGAGGGASKRDLGCAGEGVAHAIVAELELSG